MTLHRGMPQKHPSFGIIPSRRSTALILKEPLTVSESKLERYVELKQQIDKLEDELDLIKEEVFKFVDAGNDNKFENDKFTFKATKRPKYKFSDEYDAKNKELKALKKSEIADNVATIDGYSEYVTLKMKD